MTPELRALASRANRENVPEGMLSWTCLKEHTKSATVWRVEGQGCALVLKQHRHPRPFAQELAAYRDWLPRLTASADHLSPRTSDLPLLPIRVPQLLAFDLGARALALTVAPGERLSLAPSEHPAAHAAAGRFLRDLHALQVTDDDPVPLREAVAARLAEWHARAGGLLSPAERDALARLADRRDAFAGVARVPCHRDFTPDNWLLADGAFAGVARVPCHRDFTPDNWLLAGEAVHVLDFEHARLDVPEADLVKLRAEVWSTSPALEHAFFAGHGPLTADAAARLDVLLALHAVATLAWAERHADARFQALGRQALAVAISSA